MHEATAITFETGMVRNIKKTVIQNHDNTEANLNMTKRKMIADTGKVLVHIE